MFHNPLLNNDITSAIDIDNNYLVYGTIMGDVNFCIIDEFYFYKRNNSNDSNRTNANITIDDEIKKNKNDIKEIKLIKNNEYMTKNKFKYKSPFKNIKKINKNIKIYLNKEPDPEENQKTEELGSDNFNDKIKRMKRRKMIKVLLQIKKEWKMLKIVLEYQKMEQKWLKNSFWLY